MQIIKSIQNRIYEVRGERVMLDFDLAELYEVPTKVLNQAVKRNIKRFPDDFMFRLTSTEWLTMRSQIVTASELNYSLRPHSVTTLQNKLSSSLTPYAFTEQGIVMISGLLNSDIAINMHLAITRAFVEAQRLAFQETDFRSQLQEMRDVLGGHDSQLNQIYDAIENMLDEKAAQRKWNERERIGFKI
jgi:hypothetical protein